MIFQKTGAAIAVAPVLCLLKGVRNGKKALCSSQIRAGP